MSEPGADTSQCAVCGAIVTDAAADQPTETAALDADAFCSSGCRDVARTLSGPSGHALADHDIANESLAGPMASDDESLVRTHLRVDGTYSATCEAYLETLAESLEGVADASASYVTESIRVDHDPDRLSPTEVCDALSTLGYTAYLREDAAAEDGETGGTRRSREMTGMRKRRADDVLELRYIVGIVFGSFLLVPYVAVFYPVYLSAFSDWGVLVHYGDAFSEFEGVLYLPVFLVLTGAVLYLAGLPLLRGAYVSLKLRRPNTHLLAAFTIVAAYAYGTLAVANGQIDVYYDVTIVVAALVMAAVFYESTVKRRATDRLTDLTISQVDDARVLEGDGSTTTIPVADLESGDRVLVRAGERVPVDGTLEGGRCTMDEAVVTGESLPVSKAPGDDVIGGSVVTGDAAVVAVGEETTSSIDRLTETVWDVQSADHGVGRRADALAAKLTPFVLASGTVVGFALLGLGHGVATAAMGVLLTVVVVSPWALAFAPPLSVAESVTEALEEGIVVFDESVFERLRAVDAVVFDKTGTLTTGAMAVREADVDDDLLAAAAALETRASHPAAAAIAATVDDLPGTVEEFHTTATGVSGVVDGEDVLVGHPVLFDERGWDLESGLEARVADVRERGLLPVVVGRNGRAEGIVVVGDEPRANWEKTVSRLDESGVDVVVLTGDDASAATRFGDHPGVSHVLAGVSPGGKTAAVRRLRTTGTVAMVGDGTNDAPALAAADLGISLGSGTALASDAADLAIADDDLAGVERAFRLANAAGNRVRQNVGLALGYNAIAIPVALAGVMTPLFATGAIALTAVLVGANASRPLLETATDR
ncbi:heavy metal translocating P-type ATPase [Natrarchaeobaculum sulfurireducens]|uniref:Lead, cadmium, zinc and mercury transporting ATPase / Copper-translocating P-type ATPase n=1 Tax=Natrarchaeobaculum sulfurireducens TaxID=2044521 RepID=A0A346PMY8_9EURY|nr:heavy metal translocating P-type ATPase [Natrarchaeobaculum sulfurireducens]AXR80883.1 Lead, cadmium, zinc and mercury transporting ATPase / Copper-translocating P-type ATPase [Natrarchaeobaculum sulfurireducens]